MCLAKHEICQDRNDRKMLFCHSKGEVMVLILHGRNRSIVIAESLARVIAAIRIASVRWRSYLPPKQRIWSSQTLRSLCCGLNRAIGVRSFNIRSTWNKSAEWLARADRVR